MIRRNRTFSIGVVTCIILMKGLLTNFSYGSPIDVSIMDSNEDLFIQDNAKPMVLSISSPGLEFEGSGLFSFDLDVTLSEGEGSGEGFEKWTEAVIREETEEGSGEGLFLESTKVTLNVEIKIEILEGTSDNVEENDEISEETSNNVEVKNEETSDNVQTKNEVVEETSDNVEINNEEASNNVERKNETIEITFVNNTVVPTTTVSVTNDVDPQLTTIDEHTTLAPFDLDHETQSLLDHFTTVSEESFTTLAPIIPGTNDDKTTENLTPTTENPIATLETPTIASTDKPPVFDVTYHEASHEVSENPADKVHEVTYHYEIKNKAAPKASTKAKKARKSKKHKNLATQTTTIDPFADAVTVAVPLVEKHDTEIVDFQFNITSSDAVDMQPLS